VRRWRALFSLAEELRGRAGGRGGGQILERAQVALKLFLLRGRARGKGEDIATSDPGDNA
jgi:hypothetical protein